MELVAALLGALVALLLKGQSERHERRLALFALEVEELKQQFALARKAHRAIEDYYDMVVDYETERRVVTESDWSQAKLEIVRILRELKSPYLTTTEVFSKAWEEFLYDFLTAYNQLDRPASAEGIADAMDSFNSSYNELIGHLRAGLSRFRAGKEVYLTPKGKTADGDSSYF